VRRFFALFLFVALVLLCAAAQAAEGTVLDEEQQPCVMESGTRPQQHQAFLFKSDSVRLSTPARAQTVRGIELPGDSVCSEASSEVRSVSPSRVSRQTVTQQNIVERK